MTEAERRDDDELSLFALGTTLLQNRWRLGRWILIGAVVAAFFAFSRPTLFRASAAFVPQGNNEPGRPGLASFAEQFGVSSPAGNQSLSPDFYVRLLKSRVLLGPIVASTFAVPEMRGQQIPFVDLFDIQGGSAEARREKGVDLLSGIVTVTTVKATGVVQVSAVTKWRSISLAIVSRLVNGLNDYNERIRQGAASSERRFVEGRLALARSDLRATEDRLEEFLRTNRNLGNSPELIMERERLQRDVTLRQQVYTALTQSYEEARIREVRDVPIITVFEPPGVPTRPEPRGRLKLLIIGLFVGASVGASLVLASVMMRRRRMEVDAEADEFFGVLAEIKHEVLAPIQMLERWHRG
ncbi:MAG: GNVR domain-containing protein [Gemmatimonadaceae bacterium]|nr:GNVR domain-containing protein [Gemmatimonadaceae bacterium]